MRNVIPDTQWLLFCFFFFSLGLFPCWVGVAFHPYWDYLSVAAQLKCLCQVGLLAPVSSCCIQSAILVWFTDYFLFHKTHQGLKGTLCEYSGVIRWGYETVMITKATYGILVPYCFFFYNLKRNLLCPRCRFFLSSKLTFLGFLAPLCRFLISSGYSPASRFPTYSSSLNFSPSVYLSLEFSSILFAHWNLTHSSMPDLIAPPLWSLLVFPWKQFSFFIVL